MRILCVLAAALLVPLSAEARCQGQDLIAALPPQDLAPLRAAADAVPFATGLYWRATRGDEVLTLIGTLHLDDPRFDTMVPGLLPDLQAAGLLLVEAGPQEEAELKAHLARDPSILITTDGPTLPELLPEAEWQALSAAMRARGVPGFMAAKFQPWYISMLLSIPPCAIADGTPNGLDRRLMTFASGAGIPIAALEPYDTAFKVFQDGSPAEQVKMLSVAIAAEAQSEDMSATMINSYFAEDVRLSWEFTKIWARGLPGYDAQAAEAEFRMMEDSLLIARNRAWIPVIEAAASAQEGPLFIAFGALHLAGDEGVLNLLQSRGFALQRLDLP